MTVGRERIVGHVVSIAGAEIKVELTEASRAPTRVTEGGASQAIAINSNLVFSLGAGSFAFGSIVKLEARESYDPARGDELSLELMKPRRIAVVQLLGSLDPTSTISEAWKFAPSVTLLPTLDTEAEVPTREMLGAVFERPPITNRPTGHKQGHYDRPLYIGQTSANQQPVRGSFNDVFARPLAVMGNTGSGKSYTVAHLLQQAKNYIGYEVDPKFIVFDINGEYGNAFGCGEYTRKPNEIYLNGKPFGVPAWLMNAEEVSAWLQAAEQTQEPLLKDWWASEKARLKENSYEAELSQLQVCRNKIENARAVLDSQSRRKVGDMLDEVKLANQYRELEIKEVTQLLSDASERRCDDPKKGFPHLFTPYGLADAEEERILREKFDETRMKLSEKIDALAGNLVENTTNSDAPVKISKASFAAPQLAPSGNNPDDQANFRRNLASMELRLRNKVLDPRWKTFFNFEDSGTAFNSLEDWLEGFEIGTEEGANIAVLDFSMLSDEVLPFACAIVSRIFLEVRERLPANERFRWPWVLVLEEAHNYAHPYRQTESRGGSLSRRSFERIAKEGRKFGLSLIVASQRPSEISPTIISQCANYLCHRLQNPDDIDHFRRTVPAQARRQLDQISVLGAGETLAFGSAFHVPARVKVQKPEPPPQSETAAPYWQWSREENAFPLEEVLRNWGLTAHAAEERSETDNDSASAGEHREDSQENKASSDSGGEESQSQADQPPSDDLDDDIPF